MPWILDTLGGRTRLNIEAGYPAGHNPMNEGSYGGFTTDFPTDLVPFQVNVIRAPIPLPEFVSYIYDDIFVGQTARNLIEEFEPGKHKFHQTTVTRRGKPIEGRAYFRFQLAPQNILNCGIAVDDSDVTERTMKRKRRDGTIVSASFLSLNANPPRLKWRRSVVRDRHLWIDDRLQNFLIASDDLYAAFKSAGVAGFDTQECRFSDS